MPLLCAVIAGLQSRSAYWSEHAMRWISFLGSSEELFQALDEVTTAEWAPQRVRHAATRALLDRKQCRNQDGL